MFFDWYYPPKPMQPVRPSPVWMKCRMRAMRTAREIALAALRGIEMAQVEFQHALAPEQDMAVFGGESAALGPDADDFLLAPLREIALPQQGKEARRAAELPELPPGDKRHGRIGTGEKPRIAEPLGGMKNDIANFSVPYNFHTLELMTADETSSIFRRLAR